jgi:hypothetical protein
MNWWQKFTDSFETKGAQIFLLWVTDILFVYTLIHYSSHLDATTIATLTGLVGGVNGAFLGAMGARTGANGNGNGTAPKLDVSFTPGTDPVKK